MERSSSKLKNILYFRRELTKPENQNFHVFCLLREKFLNRSAKKKKFLVLYFRKETRFSKLKCFIVILPKPCFSFYNTFFYTQQSFVFHLTKNVCNVHNYILGFLSFSSLQGFLYLSRAFRW